MSEEIKKRVKHLPEAEQAELIKQMELAGCRGNYKEYGVDTARSKVEEWKKQQQDGNNNENNNDNAQANVTQINAASVDLTLACAGQKSLDLPGVEIPQNTDKKKQICHICRSEVINGVCTGCGFRM